MCATVEAEVVSELDKIHMELRDAREKLEDSRDQIAQLKREMQEIRKELLQHHHFHLGISTLNAARRPR